MTAIYEFFLGSLSSVPLIETLAISHPNFTQDYWIVRNVVGGITLTLEGDTDQAFDYYPCRVTQLGLRNNLEQGFTVTIGDVGTVLPMELDAVRAADGFATRPEVVYRAWRGDDLTAPLYGPIVLELSRVSADRTGFTFDALAPRLNISATGELYRLARFPMLRGSI